MNSRELPLAAELVQGPGWARPKGQLAPIRYLGSHPSAQVARDGLAITVFDAGIQLAPPGATLGGGTVRWLWPEVLDIEGLDHETVTSRVTATRVLLFGAVGLLAKKTRTHAYLQITDVEGIWLLEVPDKPAMHVRSWALQAKAGRRLGSTPAIEGPAREPSPPMSHRDRLEALEALRDLLDEDEYHAKRAAIIKEL